MGFDVAGGSWVEILFVSFVDVRVSLIWCALLDVLCLSRAFDWCFRGGRMKRCGLQAGVDGGLGNCSGWVARHCTGTTRKEEDGLGEKSGVDVPTDTEVESLHHGDAS